MSNSPAINTARCCVQTHAYAAARYCKQLQATAQAAASYCCTDNNYTAHCTLSHYTLAAALQEPAAAGDDNVEDHLLPDTVSDLPHIALHRWAVRNCVCVCNVAHELWHKPWQELCAQQLQDMRHQLLTVLAHMYCAVGAAGIVCIGVTLYRGFAGPPVRHVLIRHSYFVQLPLLIRYSYPVTQLLLHYHCSALPLQCTLSTH
jgi:hypothetical protein